MENLMHKYNYRSRSQPGCDVAVIARSALILVHASPHEPIGTSYHELEKAGDECGRELRICVVQMMCLLCNAALPGITAQVQMMSELRLKGSILFKSTSRIQRVFTQLVFHV